MATKEKQIGSLLLKESQVHGMKWLTDRKFRFCWAVALTLLMYGATSILQLHISRYLDHPTNIARWERYRTNMNFPAVMLLPELHYHNSKIDAFLNRVKIPPDLSRSYIKSVIRQLATFYNPDVFFDVGDLENIEKLLDFNNISLRQATEFLTTSCEEALLRCRWKGVIVNCSDLFHMELADFGYCCIFNARSLKRELANGATEIAKPVNKIFTTRIGPSSGLMIILNQSIQLSDMDRTYKWLVLTNPQRFIDSTNNNGTPISPGKEVWFGYDTESFHVSDTARRLEPGLRQCTLSDTKLEYFPVYHKYQNVLT